MPAVTKELIASFKSRLDDGTPLSIEECQSLLDFRATCEEKGGPAAYFYSAKIGSATFFGCVLSDKRIRSASDYQEFASDLYATIAKEHAIKGVLVIQSVSLL